MRFYSVLVSIVIAAVFSLFQSGFHKSEEERVRPIGTALEFGVILNAHEKVILRKLDSFHNSFVGGSAADYKTFFNHKLSVIVAEFIAVAVSFMNKIAAVAFAHHCARHNLAGI